jgi:hypothetical protein
LTYIDGTWDVPGTEVETLYVGLLKPGPRIVFQTPNFNDALLSACSYPDGHIEIRTVDMRRPNAANNGITSG